VDYGFELGKEIEVADSSDINLICCGITVLQAYEAGKLLKESDGLIVRVLNMHTRQPLDEEAVRKAVESIRPSSRQYGGNIGDFMVRIQNLIT